MVTLGSVPKYALPKYAMPKRGVPGTPWGKRRKGWMGLIYRG